MAHGEVSEDGRFASDDEPAASDDGRINDNIVPCERLPTARTRRWTRHISQSCLVVHVQDWAIFAGSDQGGLGKQTLPLRWTVPCGNRAASSLVRFFAMSGVA